MRSINVVAPHNNNRDSKTTPIRRSVHLRRSLTSRVRIRWHKARLLIHQDPIRLSIDLIRTHMHKLLDLTIVPYRLEQDLRTNDVVVCKRDAIVEGVLDVAVGREMQDAVDVVAGEGVGDGRGMGDVTFDEVEVWEREEGGDVVAGGDNVHFVKDDDIVDVGVVEGQVSGHPAAAVAGVQWILDDCVSGNLGDHAYMKPAPPVIKRVFTSASFSNLAIPVLVSTEASEVTGESIGEDSQELFAPPVEIADGAMALSRSLQRCL